MHAFRIERDVVRASGTEAVSYLHGQLSQDVAALAVGASTRTFLLEPTGKTVAWLRVTRVDDDALILDTDPGIGEAMVARLERFKLRSKCDFEPLTWQCVALRGDGTPPADHLADAAEVVVDGLWPPSAGPAVDLFGESVAIPPGADEGAAADYERLRIAAGVPVTGVDLPIDGIPNEGGRWVVNSSISFTKGCYTGQELVMRIDSRGGNVPRPLRLVTFDPSAEPPVGAEVATDGGKVLGHLTSVTAGRGLGAVGRSAEAGATVALRWTGGETAAIVHELSG